MTSAVIVWRQILAPARDAKWLTEDRIRAWSQVMAVVTASAAILWLSSSHDGVDPEGKPLGGDFLAFWTASRLALNGAPHLAYDPVSHLAAQHALFPALARHSGYSAFLYPPPFLLLCVPLALLPYLLSLSLWLLVTFSALFACLRTMLPQRSAILPIIAFPGMLINDGHGQNGFLSAACFGGGMVLVERRPFIAGMCLGVLVFKPHLLLLTPFALVATRRWALLAGVVASAFALLALSFVILGGDTWDAFLRLAPAARSMLEEGRLFDMSYVRSAFAAVRVMHGSVSLAYTVQMPFTVVAAGIVCLLAKRRVGGRAELALLISATVIASPYLQDYDLVCLALPMAWTVAAALKTGWLPYEKAILLAVYLLPLLSRPLATGVGAFFGPIVSVAFLLVIARRVSLQGMPIAPMCFPG